MTGNIEYIDKSSAMVHQLFNKTWLCRYLRPRQRQVRFDKKYEQKRDFTPFLKDFDIESVLMTI